MQFYSDEATMNTRFSNMMGMGMGVQRPADGPMRIALMSATGELKTICLPEYKEGRYSFDGEGAIEKALYIEAKDNVWYAFGGKNTCFSQGGMTIGRTAMLEDCGLLIIESEGQKCVLYSEIERKNSNVFHAYYIEQQGEFLIGRSETCDISYANKLVSRTHAALCWTAQGWRIQDRNSSNGVYLNNRIVTDAALKVGDVIYIVGLRIAIGPGFISINDADGRVSVNTPRIRLIASERDAYFSTNPVYPTSEDAFKRKPRKRVKTEIEPIEFELPPMNPTGNNIPFLLRMGSPAIMGGRALATGNIAMAITSMVLPFMTGGMSEKDRKEYMQKREQYYTEYLKTKSGEIDKAKLEETQGLNRDFPALAESLRFVENKDRMWERRKTDDDFLKLRIGTGSIPLQTERIFPKERFDVDPDPLEKAMYQLARKEVHLENVPITLPLMEDFICGISPEKNNLQLISNLIIQMCISHSYEDVKMILLADAKDLEQMSFVRMLPHFWNDDRSMRLIATNKTETFQIGEYLKNEFSEEMRADRLKERLKSHPMIVLIALDKSLFDTLEILRTHIQSEKCLGISIIASFEGLPVDCHKLIELNDDGSGTLYDLKHPEIHDQQFMLEKCDLKAAHKAMKTMSGKKLKAQNAAFALPKMVTFLEMFNAGKVEHLNPMSRWKENSPVKTLAAPVGVGTDGELFYLDLHEKSQGPHGLVAGMTGSGKSEFIITYILSMAVNYSPDEVAFILIDYKGGGLTGAFDDPRRGIHLPHLVGTITNLDGAAVQRSLMSIQSELKRRQAVFNQAKSELDEGTMDIYSYQKHFRNGKVKEPLPHLFIISDEFAELKSQRPEFMEGLISIARIGRSLGVHLILATQKPSGVVNEQIMSNTKFRVCLKVQSKADSMDMIKRQDAAELKDTGRFFLQVGFNEYFAMGQSAWCGADYQPTDHVVTEVDNSIQFVDYTGQTVLKVKPKVEKQKSETKQIVAIVRYLSDLAKRENIEPRQLWLDPLSGSIEYASLPGSDASAGAPAQISALLGMADDPDKQRQFTYELNLQQSKHVIITGHSGSGKSTLLQTMLYSLTTRYAPEQLQYYLLDFSSGALGIFNSMPHCGGFYTAEDENDVKRFLKLIKEIMAERKKLFAERDVTNYDAYIQVARMPLIAVVIDNITVFNTFKDGNAIIMTLHEYLRDAQSCGVKFVIACGHLNEVNLKTRQEAGTRIALTLKDKYEYGDALNVRCTYVPPEKPGRGLFVLDGCILEHQIAVRMIEERAAERTPKLKQELRERANLGMGTQAQRLPMVNQTETYEAFCADIPNGRIPIGYSQKDAKKISMPFAQLFTMSMYFGNSIGVRPVLDNLLFAARRERMDCIVVKRAVGSAFEDRPSTMDVRFLQSNKEDSITLWKMLVEEIERRKAVRNEFCTRYGISPQSGDVMKKAAPYIRERTRPLMVIFESMSDFCQQADESCGKMFPAILAGGFGYNFYFTCCTHYDDSDRLAMDPMFKAFLRDEFFLYFGGRFNRQKIETLPADFRKVTEAQENYTLGIMKYKGSYHPIKMPCGDLQAVTLEPDEMPII